MIDEESSDGFSIPGLDDCLPFPSDIGVARGRNRERFAGDEADTTPFPEIDARLKFLPETSAPTVGGAIGCTDMEGKTLAAVVDTVISPPTLTLAVSLGREEVGTTAEDTADTEGVGRLEAVTPFAMVIEPVDGVTEDCAVAEAIIAGSPLLQRDGLAVDPVDTRTVTVEDASGLVTMEDITD